MTITIPKMNVAERKEREASARVSNLLLQASRLSGESVYEPVGADKDGLTATEAKSRITKYGLNQVASEKPPTW